MTRASGWGGALREYIDTDIHVKCVGLRCASFCSLERAGTLIPAHHEGSSSPLCTLEPTDRSKPVRPSLLHAARAKLARQQVKSERPGLTAGAFAFCGVRTALCGKGLRARRSRGVGQGQSVARTLASSSRHVLALSLGASRDLPAARCLWFAIPAPEMHELISNRGASGKLWTARRARESGVPVRLRPGRPVRTGRTGSRGPA
jgi:hypothetical protein